MQILAVTELTGFLVELFEDEPLLQDLWISGEVSNWSRSAAGHCYFTLKDDESQLRCVLFKQDALYQTVLPGNGDAIVAHGRITIYESRGEYQLRVDLVQPAGVGAAQLAFAELRNRLEREGLFDQSRKRPLPPLPRTIGVATSPAGAVWHDIRNVVARRFPLVELVLAPTLVQGAGAPEDIAAALRLLADDPAVEVIILARGGGAAEDLAAFNDERVARAIFASRVPVVAGIGHQVDITIADLVADLRAPTPSAAAELSVPNRDELVGRIVDARDRLREIIGFSFGASRNTVRDAQRALAHHSPQATIAAGRDRIATLRQTAMRILHHNSTLHQQQIGALERQLLALNPRAVLARGYAVIEDADTGAVVTDTHEAYPGRALRVTVSDGAFPAVVPDPDWYNES